MPSDLHFEQLHLGEASPELQARLEADEQTPARLEALAESDRAILEAYPPRVVAARLGWKRRKPVAAGSGLLLLVGAAAALLVTPSLLPEAPTQAPTLEPSRIKGDPELRVFRAGGPELEWLQDGAVGRPGDHLQLAVFAAGWPQGAVLSIDGAGTVTQHHPARGTSSAELETGATELLPSAFVLDDAPDYERFFLVTSRQPFALPAVIAAIKADPETPELPSELRLAPFTIWKAP